MSEGNYDEEIAAFDEAFDRLWKIMDASASNEPTHSRRKATIKCYSENLIAVDGAGSDEPPKQANIGWRDGVYVDSTPLLHVGNSAFEDWFQGQPFATQQGIKQISRDSYAAGSGDPLVTYATRPAAEQPTAPAGMVREGWKWVPIEPTPEMCASVKTEVTAYFAAKVYKRMLAAAPAPQTQAAHERSCATARDLPCDCRLQAGESQ